MSVILFIFFPCASINMKIQGIIEVLLESFHSSHSELKNTTAQ